MHGNKPNNKKGIWKRYLFSLTERKVSSSLLFQYFMDFKLV